MIIDTLADLITDLCKRMPARTVAKIFDKERKWVYAMKNGCTPRLDYGLIGGLSSLGYELKLVKKEGAE